MMQSSSEAQEDTLKKGQWTSEEDEILASYVKEHGEGNWNLVQKNSGLARSGKSCRLRWTNHLRPDLKKGSFTLEEERQIINLHSQIGNKWSLMAAQLPGRTDNEIKNFWNTRKKKMERSGTSLYHPYSIHPRRLDGNQESSYVDISQEVNPKIDTTESSTCHQCHPLVCPLNMQYNSLYNTCVTSATPPILNQYRGLSGNSSIHEAMNVELPSFQFIQGSKPACSSFPSSINQSNFEYEPRSPRTNGNLESIFYPPKEVLEDSNNDSFHPCDTEQGDPNSTNKQDFFSQTDLTNQDALPHLGWPGNDIEFSKDEDLFSTFLGK